MITTTTFSLFILIQALLVCCNFFTSALDQVNLDRVIQAREDALAKLVKKAEELERNRCARLSSWSTATNGCNVASCGNSFPASDGFKCESAYGKNADVCGSSCEGMIRSVNKSTVLFADQTSNTDSDIQAFLSYGSQLEDELERSRDVIKAWMGIGSYSGASRWFPGNPRERDSTCSAYDPRTRGWYQGASTGPKDVILVLDVSGSMAVSDFSAVQSRLSLMQSAAKNLLSSFTINDYFAVTTFSTSGTIITSNGARTLLQGTDANKNAASRAIDGLIANGQTNFNQGFSRAYDIFDQSTERTSGCARIILFLTDGEATDSSTILNYITNKQNGYATNKPFIHTFTMSSGADQTLPKKIACAHIGIHSHVPSGANPYQALSQYYRFLAGGLNSSKPIWTERYVDAFGLGEMHTVARPYYDRNNGDLFSGVVEIDVPIGELTPYGTLDEITRTVVNRGATCPVYNITDCYLQLLRASASGECTSTDGSSAPSVATCRATNSLDETVKCTSRSGGINSMLCDPLNFGTLISTSGAKKFKDVACCDGCGVLSVGAIVGIVIGSIVGIAIIGFIILKVCAGSGSSSSAAYSSSIAGGAGDGATIATTDLTAANMANNNNGNYSNNNNNSYDNNNNNNNNNEYHAPPIYGNNNPSYQPGQQRTSNPFAAEPVYGQPVPQGYNASSTGGVPTFML